MPGNRARIGEAAEIAVERVAHVADKVIASPPIARLRIARPSVMAAREESIPHGGRLLTGDKDAHQASRRWVASASAATLSWPMRCQKPTAIA